MMRTKTSVMAGILAIMVAGAAFAGSTDAPADPTSATSAMYTLESIYQRLATGAAGAKRSGPFAEPGAGPAATGHTLDDVMGKAPAVDDTDGAGAADVANGKKFWGLKSGSWGVQTGTGSVRTCTGTLSSLGRWCDYGTAGTVMDMTTGLVWLKNANCSANLAGISNTGAGLAWSDAVIWSSAVKSGVCGLSDSSVNGDWRLPTLSELKTLTTGTEQVLSGSPGPFISVQTGNYWSATIDASMTIFAWYVHLNDGYVNTVFNTNAEYVWPVR